MPLEACIDPIDALQLVQKILKAMYVERIPLIVEVEDGSVKREIDFREIFQVWGDFMQLGVRLRFQKFEHPEANPEALPEGVDPDEYIIGTYYMSFPKGM